MIFLGLFIASLALLYLPLPLGLFHTRIEKTVKEKLGLDITVKGVWVVIAQGQVEVEGLRVTDPVGGGQALSVERVEVRGPGDAWFGLRGRWPTEVAVEEIPDYSLRFDGDRLVVPQELLNVVQRVETSLAAMPKSTTPAPIPIIRLRRVGGVFRLPEVLGGETGRLTIEEASLVPAESSQTEFSISAKGLLGIGATSPFKAQLVLKPAQGVVRGRFECQALGGEAVLAEGTRRIGLRCADVGLRVEVQRISRSLQARVDFESPRIVLTDSAGGAVPVFDAPARFEAGITVPDDADSTIRLQQFLIDSPDLQIDASALLSRRPTNPYEVNIDLRRIPQRLLDEIAKELEKEGFSFTLASRDGLRVKAMARGALAGDPRAIPQVEGTITLDDIEVRQLNSAKSLRLSNIEGTLDSSHARLRIGRLKLGQLSGTATATVRPLPVISRECRVEANAALDGAASEALDVLRELRVVPDDVESLEAKIAADGFLAFTLKKEPGAVEIEDPDWRGRLRWSDGRLRIHALQDAIVTESGEVAITRDTLELVRLRTTGGGIDMRWRAKLRGSEFFWADPKLQVQVDGETTVPALARFLGGVGLPVSPALLAGVEGTIGVSSRWAGRIGDPANGNWAASLAVRDVATSFDAHGDRARVSGVAFDLEATTQTLSVRNMRAVINTVATSDNHALDALITTGQIDADSSGILTTASLRIPVETALALASNEIAEFRGSGTVPVELTARLHAQKPLPSAGKPVIARWIEAIMTPGAFGVTKEAALRPDVRAELFPTGASFWHEELPFTITNIRGKFIADMEGLHWRGVLARIGDVDDCTMDADLSVYPMPVRLNFSIDAPRLQIMDWVSGWSQPPDGMKSRHRFFTKPEKGPRLLSVITGDLRVRELQLNKLVGREAKGKMRFEIWRNHDNTLHLTDLHSYAYDGEISGSLALKIVPGKSPVTIIAQPSGFNVKTFMTDLFHREEKMVGRLSGRVKLEGDLREPKTYVGEGNMTLLDTRVLGGPVFPTLGKILTSTVVDDVTFSKIRAVFKIKDSKVDFQPLFFDSPGVRLYGEGSIDFKAELNMIISAGFFTKTLENIPVLNFVDKMVRTVQASFLRFRVTGPANDPKVTAIPLSTDKVAELFSKESQKPD